MLRVFVSIAGLSRLREIDRRYMLLVDRNVSDDVFGYWWQAAYLAEREGAALRIAVTTGPPQDDENWLMYYFMGADLQNPLHYLPILSDRNIVLFGPEERRRREVGIVTWLTRIEEQEISHVLSFLPTSIDPEWMESRTGRFSRLEGDAHHWAFCGAQPECVRDETTNASR